MKSYDVIVIGSGGGSKITRPAANLGLKVAIVDMGRLGGTCLNHGCIPSKMFIHPADLVVESEEASRHEVHFEKPKINFNKLVERVTKTIDAESDSIKPVYENHPNIDLYEGKASFIDNHNLSIRLNNSVIGNCISEEGSQDLNSDIILFGKKIVFCTGAKPMLPSIPGLEGTPYWTYKEALRPTAQPESLIVLGGGYIGSELGHFYGSVGTKVSFLLRSEFLRPEDDEIKNQFNDAFSKRFDSYYKSDVKKIEYKLNKFHVTFSFTSMSLEDSKKSKQSQEITLVSEKLLVATGVVPNTIDVGIENTSIQLNNQGYVMVDSNLKTAEEHIWSFGDVVGKFKFRHSANFEGEYVFKQMFGETEVGKPLVYPAMPHAVFTHPQIAAIGPTENSLDSEKIVVGRNYYKNSAMGMALLPEVGFVKLIFDKETKALLAGHIIGKEAATMIHMIIAYMDMNATINDMKKMIYIHPALPENVRNAVRDAIKKFEGDI
ncbi:dihydrolipoyl dehydrogenase [bacterium]|nr:dihydrolipoyl dehydrogenase [bacterium]